MKDNIFTRTLHRLNSKTAFFVCFLSIFCAFVSCDKLPEDGDLDNNWQLMSISGYGYSTDYKAKKVFWAFRNGLAQFTDYITGEKIYCNFTFRYNGKDDGELVLFDFAEDCKYTVESNNNEWILYSNKDTLNYLGIDAVMAEELPEKADNKVRASYKIKELTSKSMILVDETGQLLVFRRF